MLRLAIETQRAVRGGPEARDVVASPVLFRWCNGLLIARDLSNSLVIFPTIENFDLLALTLLLGSVVVLSLRQFNLAPTDQSIAEVASI